MQKVFISWCGADREFKNRVYSCMKESLGDEVDIWESDERCVSNFSQECIANIRESDVFVLLLSQSAQSSSSYVINEVIEAHKMEGEGKLNIVVYNIDSCALTDEFAMQINHISDTNHVKRLRGDDDNVGVLIDRVKLLLKRREEGNPVKPLFVYEPKIVGLPIANNNYYVSNSRDNVLSDIHTALQDNNIVFVNEISGYGRKSVAKVYASQHKGEYDYALEIHTVCNSLREFLASGIEFENISEEIYDKLDERHVILKKIELIKQLAVDCNKRILIMVPFVKIARDDFDDFIISCLKALPMKVLFVTENVPRTLSDRFATIYVGRMDNKYLQELFFHYADMDDADRQAILPAINTFFDSVGGHTAAVELTAKTIADEFGLTVEDIIDALDKIKPNTDNDLSERIYSTYANLFSLKQFDDRQMEILSLLSLLIENPAPEKFITDLLKSCEIFDSPALRSLCDMGWIRRDTQAKTMCIEPIIAKVCLANSALSKEKIAKCLNFLTSKLSSPLDLAADMSLAIMLSSKLYRYLNANSFARICEMIVRFLTDVELHRSTFDGIGDLFASADDEYEELGEMFEEANGLILSVSGTYYAAIDVDKDKDTISKSEMIGGIVDVIAELGEEEISEMKNSGTLGKICFELLSNKGGLTADKLMEMFDFCINNKDELLESQTYMEEAAADDEDADAGVSFMLPVFSLLNLVATQLISGLPLGLNKLNLCRTWVRFVDGYSDMLGKTAVYHAHAMLLSVMDDMSCDVQDIDKELDFCLNMLGKYKASLFTGKDMYYAYMTYVLRTKAENLLAQSKTEEAAEALAECMKNPFFADNVNMPKHIVLCAENIIAKLEEEGDTERVKDFIRKVFTPYLVTSLMHLGDNAADELISVNSYLDMLNIDENEIHDENNFADEKELDYYSKYGLDTCDKRTYKVYEDICNRVEEFDFSSLTQQELLNKVHDLKGRASKENEWKAIAPEAFAMVSEAGYRMLGYRHHWVQYFGACCMLDGNIAQILNGEGKTYTILLVAFVHYLFGRKVNIFDASEHLCRRNYNWVGCVLRYLGLKVDIVASNLSVNNVDAYFACDVLYAVLSRFLFTLCWLEESINNKKIIGDVAIVDEADELMIQIGNLPHYISKGSKKSDSNAYMALAVYNAIIEIQDNTEPYFEINSRGYVNIKEKLYELVKSIHDEMNDDDPNWEADLYYAIKTAIAVFYLMELDKDYYLEDGKMRQEDPKTGNLIDLNSGFLAYFIAKKENLFGAEDEYKKLLAKQNWLDYYSFLEISNKYKHVCGTTATAMSMKDEFNILYGKKVICVPPNKPVIRIDHSPRMFIHKAEKDQSIIDMVCDMHAIGRPVLLLSASMYEAEEYSSMLKNAGVEHTVLNAKNANEEERILSNCGRLNAVTVATAIANRGVDIALGGSASYMTKDALRRFGFSDEQIAKALSGDNSPLSKSIAVCYADKLKENVEDVQINRQKVQKVGGLAVICTACFDELRVEQQARGRCGRQGQMGESWMFMSCEDKSLKALLGPVLNFVKSIEGEISIGLLNKMIEKARRNIQTRVNQRRFEYSCLKYTDPYREKILGLARRLDNGDVNYADVCNKFICENARFIKRWQDDELSDVDSKLIDILYGMEYEAPSKRKDAEDELKESLEQHIKNIPQEISVNNLLANMICRSQWTKFFNKVWEQYGIFDAEYKDKQSALKKRMTEFAEDCFEECIREAVLNMITAKYVRRQ